MIVSEVKKMSPLDRFIYWIEERHQIYLKRRKGLPKPWTDDEILRNYFFTNPFRENDKVTQWFRTHVRDPLRDQECVILATITFRWFNYIPTGEVLLKHGLLTNWENEKALRVLRPIRESGGKIFTGAFMINSPGGVQKLEAIVDRVGKVWAQRRGTIASFLPYGEKPLSMQKAHSYLLAHEGLGGFMAYEIVCDLRYTCWLENAPDKRTWCNPGPGAVRGLMRILDRPFEKGNNATSPPTPPDWTEQTIKLLEITEKRTGMKLEMREIEMSLCETDKYERALWGDGRLKRTYNGG